MAHLPEIFYKVLLFASRLSPGRESPTATSNFFEHLNITVLRLPTTQEEQAPARSIGARAAIWQRGTGLGSDHRPHEGAPSHYLLGHDTDRTAHSPLIFYQVSHVKKFKHSKLNSLILVKLSCPFDIRSKRKYYAYVALCGDSSL